MTARRALTAAALMLAGLLAGTAWLVATESGSRLAVRLATAALGGRLQITTFQGRLLGPLSIAELRWTTPELQVSARSVELAWTPAALAERRVHVTRLRVATLTVNTPESSAPTALPRALTLPVSLAAEDLAVATLNWGSTLAMHDLSARLASDGRRHQLYAFAARSAVATVSGSATLDGQAPFALHAQGAVRGLLADRPLAMTIDADGTLAQIRLTARAQQGVAGEAAIALTPFAAAPVAEARLALQDVDPSAWHAGAPQARLAIVAELQPHADAMVGTISVLNQRTGTLDRQHLPLRSAQIRVDWRTGALKLPAIALDLAGGGTLRGSGRWSGETLTLNLAARGLDASRLVSTLAPTRLSGPLDLTLGAARQRVRLAWRDTRFALSADAEHADDTVTVQRLELASGEAHLLASGTLGLQKGRPFAMTGELRRFDPSRFFARLPPAQLNARLDVRGRLAAGALIDGHFALTDSRYAGQVLAGRGQLALAWPHLKHADIALAAGPNTLTAKGSFGQPQDKLSVRIDAPRLAPFGIDGSLRGHLDLTGTPEQPGVSLELHAPALRHARFGQLAGLALRADLAGKGDSPLRLELTLDRLDTPGQPALAKAVRVRMAGHNQAHRVELAAEFAARRHVRLAAAGGFLPDWRWRGELQELRATDATGPGLTLRSAAPMQIASDGWSLGPAALAGEAPDWQGELQASADAHSLRTSLTGSGVRLGHVSAHLTAGMAGPWTLARHTAWQGRAALDIADLAWLGELLGAGWQSGGRFSGELRLAGTPAQPLSSGRFSGQQLLLRLPEQGLHLGSGELAATLDDNRLRIERLTFASPPGSLPGALQPALGDDLPRLRQPGRLDVSGELRIDSGQATESAFLDFHLDRLGAWQLPDQWVTTSGSGRLTWQDGILGIRGHIGVDAGYWQLPPTSLPRLSDDVLIKRPGAPPQAGLRPSLDLDLSVNLGRRFLFSGLGLQTRLTGDLRLTAKGRDLPRANGTIRTHDGRFAAYGQQLEIERGILSFQGLLDNPALDVRALRQGLAVEAGVHIGGNAQRPRVRLISDPELPDTDKLAWLVLGHGPEAMSATDATLLVAAAGDLLGSGSGNLIRQLKTAFGLDEFGFRQGELSGSGTRSATSRIAAGSTDTAATTGSQIFSIGKRLSSNAMLSYEKSLGTAESLVKLTVNLTRQISLVGRAGSDNALDLFYTRTFGHPANAQRRPPEQEKP